ncbi:hypothetical protein MMC25_005312 [Agyrium rufum]|nr:hypothetical protein [Agyrium rufum]
MAGVLLFCISEDAKDFVRKITHVDSSTEEGEEGTFYLVRSRTDLSKCERLKGYLEDNESYESDFIGASVQECQTWAREMQVKVGYLDYDLIGIADERSAKDGTVLMQHYSSGDYVEIFEPEGILPKIRNKWYDFRIEAKYANTVFVSLRYMAPNEVFPTYFGRKEELTDKDGIFDVERAEQLVLKGP